MSISLQIFDYEKRTQGKDLAYFSIVSKGVKLSRSSFKSEILQTL